MAVKPAGSYVRNPPGTKSPDQGLVEPSPKDDTDMEAGSRHDVGIINYPFRVKAA